VHRHGQQAGAVGIGYWIAPRARRRGLATRAVRLAAAWALQEGGAARVEALVEPENTASKRVVEAAGFRCVRAPANRHKPGALKALVAELPSTIETVIVTDPDARILTPYDELVHVIFEFQRSGMAAMCPRIVAAGSGWLAQIQRLEYCLAFSVGRKSLANFSITSGAAVYRRDALEKLLDEHSLSAYAEDFENALIHDLALQRFHTKTLDIKSPFVNLLRTYGVTHVLSPFPGSDPALTLVAREPNAYIYRVEGAARVRLVRAARRLPTDAHVVARLRNPAFDPDREILLLDAPPSLHPVVDEAGDVPTDATPGRATLVRESARELVVEAVAQDDGFLLLADMYYPGWRAEVDGVPTPIYRANISLRGIALPKGQHTVRFVYEAPAFFRGLWISLTALGAILAWMTAAAYRRYA